MKKRIIILCILLCLMIPVTAYAATNETVKATITKLKMYFDGSQVKGNVLTYNKVNYVPVSLLSDKLGFKVTTSSKTNKLTITEKVSKEDLRNEIDNLNSQNYDLQSQISDLNGQISDLQSKLSLYQGTIPDDSSYEAINNFTYLNTDGYLYNSNWNSVTPFMINSKVYDSNVYGIKFGGGTFKYGEFKYPTFLFTNDDLNYTSLKFSCAIDDLASSFNYASGSMVKVYGFSSSLGNKVLYNKSIERYKDIETIDVNIKGYDSIAIIFIPYVTGNSSSENRAYNSQYFNSGSWTWLNDYILFINPEVK